MKKNLKKFILLLFFLCFLSLFANFCFFGNMIFAYSNSIQTSNTFFSEDCKNIENKNISFCFDVDGRDFRFETSKIKLQTQRTIEQKKAFADITGYTKKLKNFGLTTREIVDYLLPEMQIMLEKLKKSTNIDEKDGKLLVEKNKCKLIIQEGSSGFYINEKKFYDDVLNALQENKNVINIKVKSEEYKFKKLFKEQYLEKSCFSTNFRTSSPERKNNIAVALAMFDGLTLDEGEVLSFNTVTGVRDEKAGYKKAKIISNGTFTEGFGGGVCQVSTTLYNACLLAGLDILEVHSHSLPVSYIEPSFDAMVNVGSSDLVVQNNTGGKIVFTTSSENDICKVKIYGLKNKYKITRFSEKTKIIPAEPEIIETNYKKYGDYDLAVGEEKRLSYAKDGFCSRGYLNYYDENGNLVKTKKIRENRYNSTKGIVLKRESD